MALLKTVFSRRMLVSLLMGFSSGLPLLMTMGLLQAWMQEDGLDLGTIGLINLVSLPYTWKFIWAPLMDRFSFPKLGRRRGWLLLSQLSLIVAIIGLGQSDPGDYFWRMVAMAFCVAFFSASQDIVVDAYRREDLADAELGLGSSLYVGGYRIGMLVVSGGGMILADFIPFSQVYLLLALGMIPGVLTTLLTPEPETHQSRPQTMQAAVVEPLVDYFKRSGALWILAFILFYKIGDSMAAAITTPFYLDIGFSKAEIGAVAKIFGFSMILGGGFLGGVLMLRLGIYRALWVFGILQMISTAGFAALHWLGPDLIGLAVVIAFENLSGGLGTTAFVAFMASITNKKFTASQYALLTSLMAVPRVVASSGTGFMADYLGWAPFFIICTLIAIPGLLILTRFKQWGLGN